MHSATRAGEFPLRQPSMVTYYDRILGVPRVLKMCSRSLFPHSIEPWQELALRQRKEKKRARERENTEGERGLPRIARVVSREKKSCWDHGALARVTGLHQSNLGAHQGPTSSAYRVQRRSSESRSQLRTSSGPCLRSPIRCSSEPLSLSQRVA